MSNHYLRIPAAARARPSQFSDDSFTLQAFTRLRNIEGVHERETTIAL